MEITLPEDFDVNQLIQQTFVVYVINSRVSSKMNDVIPYNIKILLCAHFFHYYVVIFFDIVLFRVSISCIITKTNDFFD